MMPVLLLALKILAGLLLAVLVLLAAALLLPLGIAVEYRPGRVEIAAVCGPVRRSLRTYRTPAAKPGGQKKQETPGAVPAPETTETNVPPGVGERPQPAPPEPPPEEPEHAAPAEEAGPKDGKLERILALLEEDPAAVAACLWRHLRWLGRHSPFKMRVRRLHVFWTVTCEDAAATAIAFGAAMTALNTALAAVQQSIPLQSEGLWLEPDFTGARRADRHIFGIVQARAILMLHLLYRVWNDPLLQPQTDTAQTAQSAATQK